ncbi:MAG: hypothetical protein KDA52_26005, partial [Planctomycetaceae bacterium]|nr:hypothetical protein [Planctomycetaceae bacterium]
LAAVLFALGGYMTAQVEHVNQIQGLAWLPWILGSVRAQVSGVRWREGMRVTAGLGLLFGLQLLAGHTQTAFISGIGLISYQLSAISYQFFIAHRQHQGTDHHPPSTAHPNTSFIPYPLTLIPYLLLGVLLAVLLAAVQLLPTLELIGLSSREGGLTVNEVLSFSWHPLLATK